MRRALPVLAMLALLAGCHSAATDDADAPGPGSAPESFAPLSRIASSKIDLPSDDETFGEGPHAELLDRNCLACHSASMVRYQPPLNRKQWTATVTKMREAYDAPFAASETPAIVDALMATAPSKP